MKSFRVSNGPLKPAPFLVFLSRVIKELETVPLLRSYGQSKTIILMNRSVRKNLFCFIEATLFSLYQKRFKLMTRTVNLKSYFT